MSALTVRHLKCHPESTTEFVQQLTARLSRPSSAMLELSFALDGDLDHVVVPPETSPAMVHFLWQHTCFEAFIAPLGGGAAYHEINLAPSREWMVYSFRDYREANGLGDPATLSLIESRHGARSLELHARLDLGKLSADYVAQPLRVGLSAVVEEGDGRLSYWSLWHPDGAADFHHRDARLVQVDAWGE